MSTQHHRIIQPDDGWSGLVIPALLIKAAEGKGGRVVGSPKGFFPGCFEAWDQTAHLYQKMKLV